jgi:hypothetical protein
MTWTTGHFLVVAISGWMTRKQQEVADCLREENRILREKLGRRHVILNESQKRGLATAAVKLGWDLLRKCGTLFGPGTPVRCRRWLVVQAPAGATQ